MYGYEEYSELTPEHILQKISQEQIFEWVLKIPFDFRSRYISPFREDKAPHCRFEVREDGTILFVDFGDRSRSHRTCFGMVMDMPLMEGYNSIDLATAIKMVVEHFNLSNDINDYKDVTYRTYETGKKQNTPSNTIITFDKQPLTKRDKFYWQQFIIKPEHLEEDSVYSCHRFYIQRVDRPRKSITPFGLCFAMDFISKVKIYQPYAGDYKWITNCDENTIGNVNNLPADGKELIIASSYKDHRVLRNLDLGLNVIWLMNEGSIPSDDILLNLLSRFKLITIFFDNDAAGIQAAHKLANVLNGLRIASARIVYLPRIEKHLERYGNYLKDPGEFIHKEGRKDLITTLNKIGLL